MFPENHTIRKGMNTGRGHELKKAMFVSPFNYTQTYLMKLHIFLFPSSCLDLLFSLDDRASVTSRKTKMAGYESRYQIKLNCTIKFSHVLLPEISKLRKNTILSTRTPICFLLQVSSKCQWQT